MRAESTPLKYFRIVLHIVICRKICHTIIYMKALDLVTEYRLGNIILDPEYVAYPSFAQYTSGTE
jgi:hypothetical protein